MTKSHRSRTSDFTTAALSPLSNLQTTCSLVFVAARALSIYTALAPPVITTFTIRTTLVHIVVAIMFTSRLAFRNGLYIWKTRQKYPAPSTVQTWIEACSTLAACFLALAWEET